MGGHLGGAFWVAADQLACQGSDRAARVRLCAVVRDDRVAPTFQGLPGVERVELGPLGVEHARALERGDRADGGGVHEQRLE